MNTEFSDYDVVVTGATGELGEAVSRVLLNAGATVHVPARSPEKARALYAGAGERVRVAAVGDLGDEAAVAAFFAGLPPIWASIHCAGGFAMSRIEATPLTDLKRMLDLNVVSTFLCCREAVKAMRGRGGRIVNLAALPGVEPRRGSGMVPYAASKAAVAAITLALAEELAGEGIWVNAVVPSIVDTEVNRTAMPNADHTRWPKPAEVAETIAFLASPRNVVTRAALVPVYGRT